MPVSKSGPEPSNNKFLKVVVALSLIVGAGYLALGGYQKVQPSAAINNGNTGEQFRGPDRQQMAKEIGITPQQQAELEKARQSGDWRGMREASERILTQEQRDKMRATMQARMAERDKKTKAMLSEADYAAMAARRQQWGGGRGGPGGGRGPGGGGPGGGGGRGGPRPN